MMTSQGLSTEALQQLIDTETSLCQSQKWRSKLPFQLDCLDGSGLSDHDDILELLVDPLLFGSAFRFDCKQFPPTEQGLSDLKKALAWQARSNGGVDIVSRGANPWKTITNKSQCGVLVCTCRLLYQNESKKFDEDNKVVNDSFVYRKTTLHNDRQNNRKKESSGKNSDPKKLRTDTKRRLTKDEEMCPFRLPIYKDEEGFFMKCGKGNPDHQFHRKPASMDSTAGLRVRLPLVPREQLREVSDSRQAHAGSSVASNLFLIRNQIRLTRGQIRHIYVKIPSLGRRRQALFHVSDVFAGISGSQEWLPNVLVLLFR